MRKGLLFLTLCLIACQPLTPVDLPGPSPTVHVPQASPTSEPSPSPSVTEPDTPLPDASGSPIPEPTILRPPRPTPSQPPSQTAYPGLLEGTVFDEQGQALNGVRLRLRSLDSSRPFEAQTETQAGTYRFKGLPTALQLELRAERPGFTSRTQVLVISEANPTQQLNFAAPLHALSDRPEIQGVTPLPHLPANVNTVWELTFSEPMDRASVQNHLVLRLAADYRPSIQNNATTLPENTVVWDQRAFDFNWSPDDSRLTLRFRAGSGLPGDRAHQPRYALGFNGPIKDKLGISRNQDFFRLGNTVSAQLVFEAQQDASAPELEALQALSAERHGAEQGDVIRVRYSKPMRWQNLSYALVGGANQNVAEAPAGHEAVTASEAAANYRVSVQRGETVLLNDMSWAVLGGQTVFEALDPTQQIVRLEPPLLTLTGDQQAGSAVSGVIAAISGWIYFHDGSQTPFEVTPEASTWAAVQAALNSQLDGTAFQARKSNQQQGALANGENWRITLAAQARSLDQEKTVALVLIRPKGLFAPDALQAPADGLRVFPGLAANARANLFQTGDQISVQIAESVRDPAGNTMRSSATRAVTLAD